MTGQKMINYFVFLITLAGFGVPQFNEQAQANGARAEAGGAARFGVSPRRQQAQAAGPIRPGWVGEGALGFIASTPDDTAFAVNLNFDRFITDFLSVGPLVQLGFTEDMTYTGVSGQGKWWFDLTSGPYRFRLALQTGIGFVNTDFRDDDTSWLIPVGVSLYYRATETLSFGATFMGNFTDLDTGRDEATVMPSLTFGVRY